MFEVTTTPPVYKHEQDGNAEFFYSLLLPDPLNEACHVQRRTGSTPEMWAFTDSQDKAKRICDALNVAAEKSEVE